MSTGDEIEAVEKRLILTKLERLKGDKKQTAAVLGISLKTLLSDFATRHLSGGGLSHLFNPPPMIYIGALVF